MKKIKLEFKFNPKLFGIIFINILNVLLVIFSVLTLQRLPKLSNEVKSLNNKYVFSHENLDQAVLVSDISGNKQKIDTIKAYFPDENGIFNFISEMEKLRNEGIISNFSFQSDKPITDRSNSQGFPILVSSEGQISNINSTLERLNSLPFFIKPIDIKITISDDGTIHLDYGGFLFISQ